MRMIKAASAADLHRITHAHAAAALIAREASFDAVELTSGTTTWSARS
jgi:2,4-dienoyl-CoA reductase-like NADH-dependent reductase (Old Yellow Enzyme family)